MNIQNTLTEGLKKLRYSNIKTSQLDSEILLSEAINKDRKYIIITEGVLDALAIDSVSSLGNKLTQGQIDLINSIGKTVIVCPDRDKSGGNLIDVAVENNWLVSFPQWENNIKD